MCYHLGVGGEADLAFMELAFQEAQQAASEGEVPVGAVVVVDGEVVAAAHNARERLQDATAHAEMLALREACAALGTWRLEQATVYVTMEPCPMCAGALVLARVKRLVYAVDDPKAGAAGSVVNVAANPGLNHQLQVEVCSGPVAERGRDMLRQFFARLRG